jgi:REP element-mobilizing transposase RayT
MKQLPYSLDPPRRACVLDAIREVCLYRGWLLLVAHVRMSHVHVVAEAEVAQEKVMNDFKSYASRALNRMGLDAPNRMRWAHHGSTRWLNKDQEVQGGIKYVVEEQGAAMALFVWDFV